MNKTAKLPAPDFPAPQIPAPDFKSGLTNCLYLLLNQQAIKRSGFRLGNKRQMSNVLHGRNGSIRIYGSNDNGVLAGREDSEFLDGGRDTIIGGGGSDRLNGSCLERIYLSQVNLDVGYAIR